MVVGALVMDAIIWFIGAVVRFVILVAMLGGFVALVVWAAKNPDQIIGQGNTWGGCLGIFGIILLIGAAAMAFVSVAPILICALVGWCGGKFIAWGIRWFFVG